MTHDCIEKTINNYTVQSYIEKALQPKVIEIVGELIETEEFVSKIRTKVCDRLSAIIEPVVRKAVGKAAEEIAKNR